MTAPELKPCPFCGADAELLGGPMSQDCYEVWCKSKQVRHHLRGTLDRDITVQRWNRRADLAAAQPAQVRVKLLVWTTRSGAPTAFGNYIVTCEDHDDVTVWFVLFGGKPLARCGEHRTEDAAKAAAQADYEARILAALEPQPDPRDEVISRLVEALEGWVNIACHCNITDGSCCCGDDMENHAEPMNCGHVPVDHGSYIADGMLKTTRAALAAAKAVPK